MKKLLFAIGLLSSVAFTSCKDDFSIAAPYKNITVAYATFNRDDTAHYIRIQKAFLDENKSAIVMATEPDSSFYTNLNVTIREYDATGNFRRNLNLVKVDLNNEGFNKAQPGTQGFFTSPNYGYKLKFTGGQTFDPYYKYRVVINNPQSGNTDSSEYVMVVNSRSDKGTGNFYISDWADGDYDIGFASTQNRAELSVRGNMPINGKMVEGMIRFHIVEKDLSTNQVIKHYYPEYTYATGVFEAPALFTLRVQTTEIYAFLKNQIGKAPANTARYVDSCDMYVYCGSNEMYTYQQVNIAQSGGLLGDQIKPNYSNLRGANIFGLIASRATRSLLNVPINNGTIDSLKTNALTADMNFKGRSDD